VRCDKNTHMYTIARAQTHTQTHLEVSVLGSHSNTVE